MKQCPHCKKRLRIAMDYYPTCNKAACIRKEASLVELALRSQHNQDLSDLRDMERSIKAAAAIIITYAGLDHDPKSGVSEWLSMPGTKIVRGEG